jgi:hypothetical protein
MKQVKQEEYRFLTILKQQMPGFPSGHWIETESPDLIITARNGRIGIEVTKIHRHSASNPLRRQESEQKKIVSEAVRSFESENSIPLEVKIHFSANSEFNKASRRRLATAIANLVDAHVPKVDGPCTLENDWTNPDVFPYEVDSISLFRLATLRCNFWSVPSAGFVQEDFGSEMQTIIAKKDALLTGYQACSEYWLLIAAEGNSASTFFHPSPTTVVHKYCSAFKRIFFLEAFTRKLWELKLS